MPLLFETPSKNLNRERNLDANHIFCLLMKDKKPQIILFF